MSTPAPKQTDHRWAPWYYYVFVLAAGNGIARVTFLRDVHPVVDVVSTVVLIVVLFVAFTAWWRRRGHRMREDRR